MREASSPSSPSCHGISILTKAFIILSTEEEATEAAEAAATIEEEGLTVVEEDGATVEGGKGDSHGAGKGKGKKGKGKGKKSKGKGGSGSAIVGGGGSGSAIVGGGSSGSSIVGGGPHWAGGGSMRPRSRSRDRTQPDVLLRIGEVQQASGSNLLHFAPFQDSGVNRRHDHHQHYVGHRRNRHHASKMYSLSD